MNNGGNKWEKIPLHLAAGTGNKDAIEELLNIGVDINVKNNREQSALTLLTEMTYYFDLETIDGVRNCHLSLTVTFDIS